MGRSRMIKSEFFYDDELAENSVEARLLFIGLWTIADRDGRLEDRPRVIKAKIFPFDDIDVEKLLTELSPKFITRYRENTSTPRFIQIVNFHKHQHVHPREAESKIPKCDEKTMAIKESPEKPGKGSAKPGKNIARSSASTSTSTSTSTTNGSLRDGKQVANKEHLDLLVKGYKSLRGIDPDDKAWDVDNYSRIAKAAKKLLVASGKSLEKAFSYMEQRVAYLEDSGLEWSLEKIAQKAADNVPAGGEK